ncbi:MAG: signal peptidase I [Candidatus Dasytiphilus stammeri]
MVNKFPLLLLVITFISGILSFIAKIVKSSKFRGNFNLPAWLEGLVPLFPILLIMLIIRTFFYEPYFIPSSSMMPTLFIGDFIIINKFYYWIKNPINQNTLIKRKMPNRGDIVVFKYPNNPKVNFIKRIIGLPGDKIFYDFKKKVIMITPVCHHFNDKCKKIEIYYSNLKPSIFFQKNNYINKSVYNTVDFFQNNFDTFNGMRFFECNEYLGTNKAHRILLLPNISSSVDMYYQQYNQPISHWLVPPGYYFMMGDNRDNSIDSRYWGFVPEENIIGKAILIWMSINMKGLFLPIKIRLNHIGYIK